jgi:site-specific recombinase XerD
MLKTGLRRGEVLGLDWRDMDIELREILVRYGKGRKSRLVPIEDQDVIAGLVSLRDRRGVLVADDASLRAPVFVSTRGTRLPRSSLYRLFHRAFHAAEVDSRGIMPHSLWLTFGSVLCARGVPVPYVKELLGHEDIGSTMVYVHSTPAALRAAVRKLRD